MRLSIILHPLLMIFSVITGHSLTAVSSPAEKHIYLPFITLRRFFLRYLTDFSYFPLKKILKVAEHCLNKSKIDLLKGGVDGFNYFSLIFSYFIF